MQTIQLCLFFILTKINLYKHHYFKPSLQFLCLFFFFTWIPYVYLPFIFKIFNSFNLPILSKIFDRYNRDPIIIHDIHKKIQQISVFYYGINKQTYRAKSAITKFYQIQKNQVEVKQFFSSLWRVVNIQSYKLP